MNTISCSGALARPHVSFLPHTHRQPVRMVTQAISAPSYTSTETSVPGAESLSLHPDAIRRREMALRRCAAVLEACYVLPPYKFCVVVDDMTLQLVCLLRFLRSEQERDEPCTSGAGHKGYLVRTQAFSLHHRSRFRCPLSYELPAPETFTCLVCSDPYLLCPLQCSSSRCLSSAPAP